MEMQQQQEAAVATEQKQTHKSCRWWTHQSRLEEKRELGNTCREPRPDNGLARMKGKNPQRYTVTKSKKSETRLNKLDTMKELFS